MKYNKIALIGMPGSGKTTVSKILSKKTNLPLFDTDEIFEKRFYNISEFFKTEGEVKFRKIETDILKEIAQNNSFIISTGGGIILESDNQEILFNKDICTFYLMASPETLYKRTISDNTRPLIAESNDRLSKIKSMLHGRENYYQKAKFIINVENKSLDMIINEISDKIL